MKKLLLLVLTLLLAFSLIGCGAEKNTESESPDYTATDISVACIKGPTGFGMAKLMEDSANKRHKDNYTFTVASSADEISGKIVTGEINIASVPTNLAAKLYAKTGGKITLLAVNTLGTLYMLEDGNTVKSFADLKGKTVYSIGEGSNPEYILKYLLTKNGLEPQKDVNIVFAATNDELISYIVSGKAKIAMVPEPAATTVLTKKDTLRKAISINDEWQKATGDKLMMGCVIALKSFVDSHPQQIGEFLNVYEESVNYAINSAEDAAPLCEKYEIVPKAAIAQKAIPDSNLTFIYGSDSKRDLADYFKVLFDFDKTSVGGSLPNDDFYFKK